MAVGPAPALFNQESNFGMKVVAGMDKANPAVPRNGWLMLMPQAQDSVKTYADLKGKTLEGLVEGSSGDVYANAVAALGGLTPSKDITLRFSVKSRADMLAVAKNKVADAMIADGTSAGLIEQQGLATKFKSLEDVAPWYQINVIGASQKALQNNRPALVKFLETYIYTAREVNQAQGKWTDELTNSLVKWSFGLYTSDSVRAGGAVGSYDPNATINLDSLHRSQDLWVQEGSVKQRVSDASLLDTTLVDDALKNVGKK
jgi:ABC-type nitrate/sulfonate/bicarbonate transport system substrate-binding protein